MDISKWRKYKTSARYYKAVKNHIALQKHGVISSKNVLLREAIVSGDFNKNQNNVVLFRQRIISNDSVNQKNNVVDECRDVETEMQNDENNVVPTATEENETENDWLNNELGNDENDIIDDDEVADDEDFKGIAKFCEDLKVWSIMFGITRMACSALLKILRKIPLIGKDIPIDPRSLVKLDPRFQKLCITPMGNGKYWHQGLERCLRLNFSDLAQPMNISLNINMDGLPLFRSSRTEFWPVLAKVHEMKSAVMTIGIYCGIGKPPGPEIYLRPFVNEIQDIITNGLFINGHKLVVSIRCFICDSPARSFSKGILKQCSINHIWQNIYRFLILFSGVAYFNSFDGCHKCTTVGYHSDISKTTCFPYLDCPERTNRDFRSGKYDEYHRTTTPLQELPIDMIKQFIVADDLHLLHLGFIKRFLGGCVAGRNGFNTKFSAQKITDISDALKNITLPKEFKQKTPRALNELSFWKGSECKTYLHYLSIVTLRDNLNEEYYQHFLLLFCGITICSSSAYVHCLDLAETLLYNYVESFICMYGPDYVVSNIHNLIHVVDEVRQFGVLSSFSSYPFESQLFQIKRLLRTGYLPLEQVAHRLNELSQIVGKRKEKVENFPKLKHENDGGEFKVIIPEASKFYNEVQTENYSLIANNNENKWFLTKKKK